MSYNVLLGISDSTLAGQAADLMAEDGDLTVVGSAQEAGDVMSGLASEVVDVVVLHEDIGPLPVMDLAREVGQRYPQVSIVLVVRERTRRSCARPSRPERARRPGRPTELRRAPGCEGGSGLDAAVARTSARRSGDLDEPRHRGATRSGRGRQGRYRLLDGCSEPRTFDDGCRPRTFCLPRRLRPSIRRHRDTPGPESPAQRARPARCRDELSHRVLEDALYVHQSGLRVLLAPENGEQEEDVTAPAARRILGGLKSNFDVVIVDVGTVVTEANTVAIDMADRVLMVSTPDVPSLRAANRLLEMWNRLEIRAPKSDKGSEVLIVLNRAHRDSEVQPDLVRKVVRTTIRSNRCVSWRTTGRADRSGRHRPHPPHRPVTFGESSHHVLGLPDRGTCQIARLGAWSELSLRRGSSSSGLRRP